MSKLIPVVILCDAHIVVGDETIKLAAGSVPDLEPQQAAALIAAGQADSNPVAVAFHRGEPAPAAAPASKRSRKAGSE